MKSSDKIKALIIYCSDRPDIVKYLEKIMFMVKTNEEYYSKIDIKIEKIEKRLGNSIKRLKKSVNYHKSKINYKKNIPHIL